MMTADRLAKGNSANSVNHGPGRILVRYAVALPVLAVALLASGQWAGAQAHAKAPLRAAKPVVAADAAAASSGESDKVAQALARGDVATAQGLAEAAVAQNPGAAGLRVVLGRVYLRAGRFESAAAMLADARTLGDTSGRTALGLALAKIACGQGADAVALLDAAHDTIPVGDYGLALAMAGDAPRGITVLGDALRGGDQSPKLRQNLAYAFALGGRWGEARMMAAFDTPADKLDGRLSQWAETAQPDATRQRVANLIGVPLRDDAGAPKTLALASSSPTPWAAATATPVAPLVVATGSSTAKPVGEGAGAMHGSSSDQLAAAEPAPIALPVLAALPATAQIATKTDANGELPAVERAQPATAQSAAALAAASLPAEPAPLSAMPATAMAPVKVILHRADTTRLVGVALAHADVVAARSARHHGRQHADHAAPQQLAVATPVQAEAVDAKPAEAKAAETRPEVASQPANAALPAGFALSHAHKIHGQKNANLAQAPAIPAPVAAPNASGATTHMVQLGSFSSQQNAEHARQTFLTRDPALGHRQFVITQALVNGRNFWRVAVMGFDASSAGQTCSAIRHHGGACFAYAAGHLPGGQMLGTGLALATPQKEKSARR